MDEILRLEYKISSFLALFMRKWESKSYYRSGQYARDESASGQLSF
jgi:hypothetical protein